MEDAGSINNTNNNIDGKNTYTKTSFNIYNISSIVANNTSCMRNNDITNSINNNTNNKNVYIKAYFNIYNITDTNTNANIDIILPMIAE